MMAYTSLFLLCVENGDDKSEEEISFHYLFSKYMLITTVLAVIIICIFE